MDDGETDNVCLDIYKFQIFLILWMKLWNADRGELFMLQSIIFGELLLVFFWIRFFGSCKWQIFHPSPELMICSGDLLYILFNKNYLCKYIICIYVGITFLMLEKMPAFSTTQTKQ